jgi:prepilin-type N-terminal cleavage/methylation domain-containing protein
MKKHEPITLPKIDPRDKAAQLKRAMGKDHALKLASGIRKNLKDMNPGDYNTDITSPKDVAKSEQFWAHVAGTLRSQKGFTAIELIFCLAILGIVCLAIAEIGVIAHFVAKFW